MKLSLPHPFVLLMGAVGTAVLMTWVVPAGREIHVIVDNLSTHKTQGV